MISFLKKLLFCVGFCILFTQSVLSVSALNDPAQNSEMTYGIARQLATNSLDAILQGFVSFKVTYETQSQNKDPKIAAKNQKELDKLNPKYDKILNLLVSVKTTYDTELSKQESSGVDAKIGHKAAADAAMTQWGSIYRPDLFALLTGSPALSSEIQTYFDKGVQTTLSGFVDSAQKIKDGQPPSSAQTAPDKLVETAADAIRTGSAGNLAKDQEDPGKCDPLHFEMKGCFNAIVAWVSRNIFVTVPMFIFYLCGIFLDFSISFGLEAMKTLVNDDIYNLWLFTRNLVLAASLFSFLYFIGMVIVGLGNSIQRAAASVILFALFSGFSFSVSTYLIDISNLVTVSLYNSVDSDWASHSVDEPVIAKKFMTFLGYRSLKDAVTGPAGTTILGKIATTEPIQILGLNFLVGLTLIYNAYVLLMMSLLFVVRDLGLIVGVVFSPLMLVDQAVPKLSDMAKKFRSFFVGQLLIGPVFMFLMYIGLKICDIAVKGVNQFGAKVGSGAVGSPGVILFQILMITGVFWYTYKICKSLSGVLGDAALGALGGLAQKAMIATPLGLAGQAGSFIGKNTVGRAARKLTEKGGVLHRNQDSFLGRTAFNAMNYTGNKATFDFNNSKVFASAQGAAQKMGMSGPMNDGGFAGKGLSYVDAREAALKQAEKHAKNEDDPEVREKLINSSLEKFRRGNILGSATGQKDFEKMQKQARKSSVSGQRTSLTDQVSDINFEDLHSDTQEKKDAVLTKLKELHAKAEKGGEYVKKWFDKYLQNKILTETTNAIKDDVKLDPLSSNFNESSLRKYQGTLQVMLTAGLGLDKVKEGESEKERKEREAEGEKVIGNMIIKLTREVEQIANEKRRGSESRTAKENNGETSQTSATKTTTPIDIDLGETTTTSSNKKANEDTQVYFDLDLGGDITNSLQAGQFAPPTAGGGAGTETSAQTQNSGPRSPTPQSARTAPETAAA